MGVPCPNSLGRLALSRSDRHKEIARARFARPRAHFKQRGRTSFFFPRIFRSHNKQNHRSFVAPRRQGRWEKGGPRPTRRVEQAPFFLRESYAHAPFEKSTLSILFFWAAVRRRRTASHERARFRDALALALVGAQRPSSPLFGFAAPPREATIITCGTQMTVISPPIVLARARTQLFPNDAFCQNPSKGKQSVCVVANQKIKQTTRRRPRSTQSPPRAI